MKIKFKFLTALFVLLFATLAQAQLGGGAVVVSSGLTSGAYAAVTNNTSAYPTNAIVDCSQQRDVSIQFTSALHDAGTTANTVVVQESVDKTNWETLLTFTATPAGTTPVTVVTNITVGASPFLRVYSIANANANTGHMTNYTIKAWVK